MGTRGHHGKTPGEGPTEIPPRRFTRKMEARLERLHEDEPGMFDEWRLKQSGPNRNWMDEYDKFRDDLQGLFDSLLGRNADGDDPDGEEESHEDCRRGV